MRRRRRSRKRSRGELGREAGRELDGGRYQNKLVCLGKICCAAAAPETFRNHGSSGWRRKERRRMEERRKGRTRAAGVAQSTFPLNYDMTDAERERERERERIFCTSFLPSFLLGFLPLLRRRRPNRQFGVIISASPFQSDRRKKCILF